MEERRGEKSSVKEICTSTEPSRDSNSYFRKPPIDYYMNELKHCIDPMWNPTIEDIKINLGIHDREPEGKAERVKEMIIQKIGPIRRKAETEKIKERLLIGGFNPEKVVLFYNNSGPYCWFSMRQLTNEEIKKYIQE